MNGKGLIILLFIGLLLCEIPGVIYLFFPETETKQYNLYLDKDYKQQVTVLWYIYDISNILNRLIWAFVVCNFVKYNNRLFKAMIVFIAYYITEFLFYIWNRNSSYFANTMNYTYMVCILFLIWNADKNKGKYVKM